MYTDDELKKIASELRQEIDNASLVTHKQDRRAHLGASEIGEECLARLWYQFRWITQKSFEPRMLRLFNRGHKEEQTYADYLRSVGFTVWDKDPETGEQFLFHDFQEHYGGATDGICVHPIKLPGVRMICEFKTHNEKSFTDLKKHGVEKSKPKHYIQMCNYGKHFECPVGVYVAGCKNDDDIHLELKRLDWSLAQHMTEKAGYIIGEQRRPPKIHNASPVFWRCKDCEGMPVCFYRKPADKNCRSCIFAVPGPYAEWGCMKWGALIPKEVIPQGCHAYHSILEQ